MRVFFFLAVLSLPVVLIGSGVCCAADELSVTNLKRDERVVFLTTDARRSQDARTWIVPIHAWVHEYEQSTVRKATIASPMAKGV